ncbi:Cna B-type domain-containing protein [Corticicoccus populi]|uniref:Cna B-type domain-containing protein n=1 Tax=Corticicoccus populi TaxID=1812821 RepID=A0ABW5X0I4_9STAP
MKRYLQIYLAIILVVTSLFSYPLSVLGEDNISEEDMDVEIDSPMESEATTEEASNDEENTREEEPVVEENNTNNTVEETISEEVNDGTEEAVNEDDAAEEEETAVEEEQAVEEEDEEKQGFSLEVKQAVDMDGNAITTGNALNPEATFVLQLDGRIKGSHNYEAGDVETYQLPASVNVANATTGQATVDGTNVAAYTVNANGNVVIEFNTSIESVGNTFADFKAEVVLNSSTVDESAEEAYIAPIGSESGIVVPLDIESDEEKQGFSLELSEALTTDEEAITEEAPLDPEDAFTLVLNGNVSSDINYEAGDELSFNIPASVNVEASEGVLIAEGIDIAHYVVGSDNSVSITFTEGVETADASIAKVNVETTLNESAINTETNEAVISPIDNEAAVVIPLAVESDEEKQGFSLELSEALTTDDEAITEEAPLDPEDVFTLVLNGKVSSDINYEAGDTVSFKIPASVEAEATEGTLSADDTKFATYVVNTDNTVDVEFTEGIESVKDTIAGVDVDVTLTESLIDAEAEEANIEPIGDENSLTIPLDIDESSVGPQNIDGFNLQIDSLLDMSGVEISDQNPLGLTDEFILNIHWSLDNNHGINEGDTLTIDLPQGILIVAEASGTLDVSGEPVLDYVIRTDGTMEITFRSGVENWSNIEGIITAQSSVDIDNAVVEDNELVLQPIGEEGEKRFPIDLGERNKTIEKAGEPNRNYNAETIDWTITANTGNGNLTGSIITDTLPEGVEYQDGSLVVTRYDVNLNGQRIGEGEVVEITPTVENGVLTIPVDGEPAEYVIEYTTDIVDDEATSFRNNAVFTDDDLEPVGANATVTIDRGSSITKSAGEYNPVSGEIEWTVEFNYNQKSLEGETFEDSWQPAGVLNLVGEPQFERMTINPETGAASGTGEYGLPDGALFTAGDDSFSVTGITTNEAYRVTYTTTVADRVMDGLNIENVAGYGEENDGSGINIGQFIGNKSISNVNYLDRTIDWVITINRDEYEMNNIVVEDTLSSGLTLVEDSMSVTVGGNDYNDFTLSGDNPFTVTFPENYSTDDVIVITYQTSYEPDALENNRVDNTADIRWVDTNGDSQNKTVDAGQGLNQETNNSSWKNGSYDPATKEITWRIYANYRQNSIDNLVIHDMPQGNQQLIEDSVIVRELNINSGGGHSPGETVDADVSYSGNTFTAVIGETSNAYYIEYKTSLEGLSDIAGQYKNQAEIRDGDTTLSEVDAEVGIANNNVYADKSGNQNGNIFRWSVNINAGQQVISNLVYSDTLSDNQEVLDHTITVYEASVDGNGNLHQGNVYDPSNYTLNVAEDSQSFSIAWNDGISRPFMIEYSSLFFAAQGEEVSNSYEITGDENILEDGHTSGTERKTVRFVSGGSATGEVGYLMIDKIDVTNNGDDKLGGATFELRDVAGNVIRTGTTNEDGVLDFGRLLYGNYILVETNVPDGYVNNEIERPITINSPYTPGDNPDDFAVQVENFVPVYEIDLTKQDDLGEVIPGVTFELYNSEDELIGEATTDENGFIKFSEISEPGQYYVVETNAPDGYVTSGQRHPVTVEQQSNVPAALDVVNNRTLTNLSGEKIWNDADNQDGLRPDSITVELLADGEAVDSKELNASTNWAFNFNNLPTHQNGEEITYTVDEIDEVEGYTTEIVGNDIINAHTPEQTEISGVKTWDDADNQDGIRPNSIEVQLLANGEVVQTQNVTSETDWSYTFTELPVYETGETIEYTVAEVPVDGYETLVEDFDITNSYTPEVIDIPVNKVWDDEDDQDGIRPDTITFNVLDGISDEPVRTQEVSAEDDWSYVFENLPRYNNGVEIEYTVTENTIEDYSAEISSNEEGVVEVLNTHTPDETSVTVTKAWNDENNQDGIRPDSIEVQLTADGEPEGEVVELNEGNDWSTTWSALPLNASGEAIDYSVEEVNVPEGYTSEINDEDHGNIIVSNSYTPEVTEIPVNKVWDDADNQDGIQPGSIMVNVAVDDDVYASMTLSEDNDWSYVFEDLPVYNDGEVIEYTVTETPVDGYEIDITEEEGSYTVTNSRTPDVRDIDVTKSWDDGDNQDGNRPDIIEVQLYANGEPDGDPVELSEENEWSHEWNDLPVNASGQAIQYSVEELHVPDEYLVTISQETMGSFEINNAYTPQVTEVTGVKTWDDGENQDGIRPGSIEVQLLADDEVVDTRIVTSETEWGYEFTELPVYEAGEVIDYTINEVAVDGYETEITGNNLTNSYTPELIDIPVTKIWDDADNQDGVRPNSVFINVLDNEGVLVRTQEVTADDEGNWSYVFEDLPRYNNGVEIEYSVTENSVEDYSTEVVPTEDGFEVTNAHTPGETSATVTKIWNDGSNQDGTRPDSIEVQLTMNGEAEGEVVELNAENDWTHTWNELPVNAEGEAIDYSVEEVNVPEGYESAVSDEDHGNIMVVNSYTPEEAEIPVTKVWEDSDNQDGVRPDTVTVNVLADGEIVGSYELTEENEWSHVFEELPVYNNGQEIEYTVTEDAVDGYEADILPNEEEDGYIVTNNRTPDVTDIDVTKVWEDSSNQDGNRPDSIEVQLLANEETVGDVVELNTDNDWSNVWNDLPVNASGEAIEYSVEEVGVPEGYTSEVSDIVSSSITVTNNYSPEETEVSGTKTWTGDDSQTNSRPDSIEVQLLADGEVVNTLNVTAETEWTYEFTELPVYNNGEAIEYTVDEVSVDGYETEIDGFDIINTFNPDATIDIPVTKVWDDEENQDGNRPDSITYNLLDGTGNILQSQTVTEEDDWTYVFENLPMYSENVEINYTVTENTVQDYSTSIAQSEDEVVVTNTHTPAETSVTVTKGWADEFNAYASRPNSIEVQLTADGEAVGDSIELTVEDDWTHTWNELPINDGGNAINYSVEEVNVPEGYTSVVNDDNHGNLVVTNTYTSPSDEVIDIPVTKVWEDEENQDDVRPGTIHFNVLADGEVIASAPVTEEDDWSYVFEKLPVYNSDGEEIEYTVTENAVDGYESDVSPNEEGSGFVVTNSRDTDVTAVNVEKVWEDDNNQDGNRPNEISVQLYADGEPEGEAVSLNASNDWSYSWTNLDEKSEGSTVQYRVAELDVPDNYSANIDQSNLENIVITNSYTPVTIDLPVNKTWDDNDNADNTRPDSVTVHLFDDQGTEVEESVTLNSANDWNHVFENLPKYRDNGQLITYYVTEDAVEDYTSHIDYSVESIEIINTHTPDETSVTVLKAWNDYNNQDDSRPDEVEVQLYADGESVGDAVTLTKADNWLHTWMELPVSVDGEIIEYTVEEVNVPEGYEAEVNDVNYGGVIITNTYVPETMDIPVAKTWNHGNNDESDQPDSINVYLVNSEGTIIETVELNDDNDWKHTFTDMPVNEHGKPIDYRVFESDVKDYNSEVISVGLNFDLVNTYSPDETTFTVVKGWNDNKDYAEKRPEAIKVQLYKDGEAEGESVEITANDKWKHTFEGLDSDAEYTVEEIDVPKGYKVSEHKISKSATILVNNYKSQNDGTPGVPHFNDKEDGTHDGSGTSDGSGGDREGQGSGSGLPLTGVAATNVIVIVVLLLLAGAGFLIYSRRKS